MSFKSLYKVAHTRLSQGILRAALRTKHSALLFNPGTKQAGITKEQGPLKKVKLKNRYRLIVTPANGNTTVPKVQSLETLRMTVMQEGFSFSARWKCSVISQTLAASSLRTSQISWLHQTKRRWQEIPELLLKCITRLKKNIYIQRWRNKPGGGFTLLRFLRKPVYFLLSPTLDSDFFHAHFFQPDFLFNTPEQTGTYLTGRGPPQWNHFLLNWSSSSWKDRKTHNDGEEGENMKIGCFTPNQKTPTVVSLQQKTSLRQCASKNWSKRRKSEEREIILVRKLGSADSKSWSDSVLTGPLTIVLCRWENISMLRK